MPHSPLRLIVVEDHADTAEGLKKFLKAVGYQVFVATDVASALSLASSVEFDLLLSDIALPDGNGWELLKQLSAEAGFVEHLPKPLSPDKLCAAIERAAAVA